MSLLAPLLLGQGQNQTDEVRILGPLDGSDVAKSDTTDSSHGGISAVAGVALRSDALEASPLDVVVVEVADDGKLGQKGRGEMADVAVGNVDVFAVKQEHSLLIAMQQI